MFGFRQICSQNLTRRYGLAAILLAATSMASAQEVYIEAECGDIGTEWSAGNDSTVSAGVFVEVIAAGSTFDLGTATEPVTDMIQYQFVAPATGVYDVYSLSDTPDTGSDSFHYSFTVGEPKVWTTVNNVSPGGVFAWDFLDDIDRNTSYQQLTATSGDVVDFFVSFREGDIQIDKFAFVIVGDPAPTGLGGTADTCFDFGDAPDGNIATTGPGDYNTLQGDNANTFGPVNIVPIPNTATVFIGSTAPDTETTALQSAAADGDDASDEGEAQLISTIAGNVYPALSTSATDVSITIDVTNNKVVDARLMAWLDFNNNGQFDEDERADATPTIGASVGAVQQTLIWTGITPTAGDLFLRLRLSTDSDFVEGGTAAAEDEQSIGALIDGETEDHTLFVAPPICYSAYADSPGDPFPNNTVFDLIALTPAPTGSGTETEFDVSVNDGDADGSQYGMIFTSQLTLGAGGSFDFRLNSDDGSHLYINDELVVIHDGDHGLSNVTQTGVPLSAGTHSIKVFFFEAGGGDALTVSWTPAGTGTAFEELQLSLSPPPSCPANPVFPLDYGDAPAPYDFAAHALRFDADYSIGSILPDVEDNNQPNVNANGDGGDEDGAPIFPLLSTISTGTYNVDISVTNAGADATLGGWIDFDGDNVFEANEYAEATVTSGDTTASLSFDLTGLTLTEGVTYARFRIARDSSFFNATFNLDSSSATDAFPEGEVEDYTLTILGDLDFGDAPDTSAANGPDDYSTLFTNNGPGHGVVANLFLGSTLADEESNGFENGVDDNGNASDDDSGGDEGASQLLAGVSSFPALDVGDPSYSFNIDVFNNTGTNANIYAWIDFDRNGTFDEDELAGTVPISVSPSGSNQLETILWSSLPGISAGATYMRLRITTETPDASGGGEDERSLGLLSTGEVEDYLITVGNLDYADAPAPYKTLLADDGPRHSISNNLYLGDSETGNVINNVLTDLDTDGYGDGTDVNGDATDDNVSGVDDENLDDLLNAATTFPELLTAATNYSFDVNFNNQTGGASRIYAWIDFDQSGTFDVDEAIDGLFGQGDSQVATLTWAFIPNDIQAGTTYARFRIASTPLIAAGSGEDIRSLGFLSNGEVEDHAITIDGVDFGDAPSSYATLLAGNGPRHEIGAGTLFIGSVAPDGDSNGFGNGTDDSGNASDDDNELTADEGISDLLSSGAASFPTLDVADTTYTLAVDVTNGTGSAATLHGWIDFDNDGTFDTDERAQVAVSDGTTDSTVSLVWTLPVGVDEVVVSATYARFRIRLDSDSSTLPSGLATAGEVEDYRINIEGDTTIAGTIFEDINYGGGAGRDYTTADAAFTSTNVGTAARVELWTSDGSDCLSFVAFDTAASGDGSYSFSGASVSAPDDYCIRVVTNTVESNRAGFTGSELPVQTFRSESTDGVGSITSISNEVGGRFPALADTANSTWSNSQTSSWSIVSTDGVAVSNVDFGFSFNTIVNTNDAGQGSLRQFISNANALDNANIAQSGQTSLIDVSIFEIPSSDANFNGSGQNEFTISPASALPLITDPIELNGETQDGASCPSPIIELNGSATTGNGFDITAGNSSVKGFIVNNWSAAGINATTAANNTFECNYLGTNAAGSLAQANNVGISISAGALSNTIGGSFATSANVISGNTTIGISITTDANVIQRNIIGLAADGGSNLGNGAEGVLIAGSASNNEVGDTSSTNANIIAGNGGDGIAINGTGADGNSVRVNRIFNNGGLGLNLSGPNTDNADVNDTDGGANSGLNAPVLTVSTVISGSDLVVDATLQLDNRSTPIYTLEVYANPVCNSDEAGLAQVPADGEGFQFLGSFGLTGTTVGENLNEGGTLTGIVPTLLGGGITAKLIEENGDTSEFSNCIQVAPAEVISGTVFEDVLYGGGFGRDDSAGGTVGVMATVELWSSSGGICTGSAPLQSVSTSLPSGDYSFTTAVAVAEYCVRVANTTVQSSRAGWVPGIVPVQTYGFGDGTLVTQTGRVGGLSPRDVDSAPGVLDTTANDGVRTQTIAEISNPTTANVDFGFSFSTVVNTNSSGQGSLSQFIDNANALTLFGGTQAGSRLNTAGVTEALPAATETSIFMISNGVGTDGLADNTQNLLGGSDVAEISFVSTQTISRTDISIDGSTQTLNVTGNTTFNYNGISPTVGRLALSQGDIRLPEVQISGGGITINATDTQVRGLAFLPTTTAVTVNSGADNAMIEQNGFGVSAVSFSEPGSGSSADLVIIDDANNGTLSNNAFGFGSQSGLRLGNGSLNWAIDDNLLQGFSQAGITTIGNYSCASFERNQLTANNQGIAFTGTGTCSVVDSTINENTLSGIDVNVAAAPAANITLEGNLITENGGDGVSIVGASTRVEISDSHIFNNGDLGIDLENDNVVTTGEGGGANLNINIPIINAITADGDDVTVNVTGTSGLSGLEIDLFSSAVCNGDTSGISQAIQNGEGEKLEASISVTSGVATDIVIDTGADPTAGDFFTAVLRDSNGNTSEFSACAQGLFDDYGDAPDSYGTNLVSNGARHGLSSTLSIGATVPDGDTGSNASAGADGDDITGADDEEIASFPGLTSAAFSYSITVNNVVNTSGSAAELTAWIDFDGNGTFDNDEAASVTVASSGSFDLEWVEVPTLGQGTIPADIDNGSTFLRLRLSSDASVLTGDPTTSLPLGEASDGEVEDYPFTIAEGFDFGDAPASFDVGSPARHARLDDLVYLGVIPPDGDTLAFGGDGVDNDYNLLCATGTGVNNTALDDDCEGLDDEDSAQVFDIVANATVNYSVDAGVTNNTGGDVFVYAWLDVNQNGVFDASEGRESTANPNPISASGVTLLTFDWTAINLSVGDSHVRIRVSRTDLGLGGFQGDAPDGEVEDYALDVSLLTCNTLYGHYNTATPPVFALGDIRIYTPPTTLSAALTNTQAALAVSSAGTALDPITKRYYYMDRENVPRQIFYYDGATHTNTGATLPLSGNSNYNRAAFSPDGLGYTVLSGDGADPFTIIRFTTAATPVVTNLGGITGITDGVGGDIAFDIEGNMYMVTYDIADPLTDQFYLYRIPAAELTGTNPAANQLLTRNSGGEQVAGIAFFTNDSLFMQGIDGTSIEWNLSVTTDPVDVGTAAAGSADLASCIYPQITSVVDVTKTVANITEPGSAGFTPGDILEYTMTVRNTGALIATDVMFSDQIPLNTTYISGSTTLEEVASGSSAVAVADISGNFPFLSDTFIQSAGGVAGELASIPTVGSLENAVVIKFRVQVDSSSSFDDAVCNISALVNYEDIDNLPARIIVGSNDPTTGTEPGLTNSDTETSDPTCLDKVSGYGISGFVYEDDNLDDLFDNDGLGGDDETPLAGVSVVLRNNTLSTCTAVSTAADGSYSFFPLDLGNYTVFEAAGTSLVSPPCPPIEADPSGFLSSSSNNLDVTLINADINDQNFADVRPPLFSPNNSGIVQPGDVITYSHTLVPRADGNVSFSLGETTIPSLAGWAVSLNNDLLCDGLDITDPIISGAISATAGTDLCILVRVTAPITANATNQHIATISATFDYIGSVVPDTILSVTDTTTVVSADDGALLLIKTVENITPTSPYFDTGVEQVSNQGDPGDELLYRVKFQNVGNAPITDIDIFDTTPAFTELSLTIPANCVDSPRGDLASIPVQIPAGLSCSIVVDGANPIGNNVGYTGSLQWVLSGTLGVGEQGFVVFSVTID